jgi:hypothetical protein
MKKNTNSTGLTVLTEAADEVEHEGSAHTEAVEAIRETNDLGEVREQNSNKRNAISAIRQAVGLTNTLSTNEKKRTSDSINRPHTRQNRSLPWSTTAAS